MKLKRILFILLQCTWALVPTLIGFLVFLFYCKCPHKIYRGCIDTRWNMSSGLSMGLFIFTPNAETGRSAKMRVHEYGHCLQSALLGPLYLLVGLISIVWAGLPYFKKLRREKQIPYTACFVESWASKWGQLATGEKAI